MSEQIPALTIDTLARSIFKEASSYGFRQVDIIRLINTLMDLCTDQGLPSGNGLSSAAPIAISEIESLPIRGENLVIRGFEGSSDKSLLETWLPDKYGRFFVLSCATAQSLTVDALCETDTNHLGIVCLHDGTPIGAMAYLDHSKRQNRAELRKLIGAPEYRGRGFAEEATRLWIAYGLSALGLEKIYVSTLQTQIENIRLNESVGFRVEGLLRNEICVDGARCDVLRMGLNAEESASD